MLFRAYIGLSCGFHNSELYYVCSAKVDESQGELRFSKKNHMASRC